MTREGNQNNGTTFDDEFLDGLDTILVMAWQ